MGSADECVASWGGGGGGAPAPRGSLNFRRASLLSRNEFESGTFTIVLHAISSFRCVSVIYGANFPFNDIKFYLWNALTSLPLFTFLNVGRQWILSGNSIPRRASKSDQNFDKDIFEYPRLIEAKHRDCQHDLCRKDEKSLTCCEQSELAASGAVEWTTSLLPSNALQILISRLMLNAGLALCISSEWVCVCVCVCVCLWEHHSTNNPFHFTSSDFLF